DSRNEEQDEAPTPIAPCTDKAICGPDVTTQVKEAVAKTKAVYAKGFFLDGAPTAAEIAAEQKKHFDALTSWSVVWGVGVPSIQAQYAWDIRDLKSAFWRLYQPECCTTPRCEESVQIGNQCHYMGSVNYVIFGVMCELCKMPFDDMTSLIRRYKEGAGN